MFTASSTLPHAVAGEGLRPEPVAVVQGEKPENQKRMSYEQQKELQKKLRKLEKEVAACENRVSELEQQIADVENKLATAEGASDVSLYELHGTLKKQMDEAVDAWEAASEALDEAKA